jgi:SsrA-binding protein
MKQEPDKEIIARNRKAAFQYHLLDAYECGIVLVGTEVKSLRERQVSINESFARVENGEVFLYNMQINPYEHGNRFNHDPKRVRKLLLHRKEIERITGKVQQRGFTLVPLSVYFKDGFAKIELAVARGKSHADKREDLKSKDAHRAIKQEIARRKLAPRGR